MSSSVTHTETTTTLRAADGDRSCVIVVDNTSNEEREHLIDVTFTKDGETKTFRIESDSCEIDSILMRDNYPCKPRVYEHVYFIEAISLSNAILSIASDLYAFSLAHQ